MLRRAQGSDIGFIQSVMNDEANFDKLEAYAEAVLQQAFANEAMRFFIWDEDGARGGYLWLTGWDDRAKGPKIEEFAATLPGRGIGRLMMQALDKRLLAENGSSRCWLKVAADNAGAIRFYEGFGFMRGVVQKAVWHRRKGPVADALAMVRG